VKYILLIYQQPGFWQTVQEAERDAVLAEVDTIISELTASGEWIGGEALADASTAKSIRLREGAPAVTDGPFIEAKEQLAGYCLFQAETPERAVEIAARWPDARYIGVELRPLMTESGTEM
jgi:hypothetical protein